MTISKYDFGNSYFKNLKVTIGIKLSKINLLLFLVFVMWYFSLNKVRYTSK